MNGCLECDVMIDSGLFTEKEVTDYHNGERDVQSFDARQQEVIWSTYRSDEEDA
jgi:hypothetical protein